ncbi:TPA: hypothetical protein TXI81_001577 [Streptococcus suis]|nr:hypothetical protein [Streptococcus suis]
MIEVVTYNADFIGFHPIKTLGAKLKIQCPQGRAGSTPAAGIVYEETLIYQRFFFCFVWRVGWF